MVYRPATSRFIRKLLRFQVKTFAQLLTWPTSHRSSSFLVKRPPFSSNACSLILYQPLTLSRLSPSSSCKHPAGPPASHPIWNKPSLSHLIDNNKKWVSSVKAEDPDYFKRLASIHTPEHLFIGCSDARLSVQSMLVSISPCKM